MLKKLLMLVVALSLSLTAALAAAVEVNTADQAALESVKGLGPVKSKAIIDERAKNGPFKDADDLANRVKGLGAKSVANLEAAGLTIGGSTTPPTGAKAKTSATKPAVDGGKRPGREENPFVEEEGQGRRRSERRSASERAGRCVVDEDEGLEEEQEKQGGDARVRGVGRISPTPRVARGVFVPPAPFAAPPQPSR